jgi:hypothetical protein
MPHSGFPTSFDKHTHQTKFSFGSVAILAYTEVFVQLFEYFIAFCPYSIKNR